LSRFFAYSDDGDEALKTKIKLWLFFGLLYLFGAFLSAGLTFTYDLTLFDTAADFTYTSLSFSDYVLLTCRFLQPFLLMFLSAFTLFACAVSATGCLFMGMMLGEIVMGYCLSPLTPFTHAAGLIFLLGYGALFTVLSALTALYRSSLKNAAPDLKVVARDPKALSLLYSFLAVCAIAMTLSAALYLFLFYFPL
jgi:hypothetical protein